MSICGAFVELCHPKSTSEIWFVTRAALHLRVSAGCSAARTAATFCRAALHLAVLACCRASPSRQAARSALLRALDDKCGVIADRSRHEDFSVDVQKHVRSAYAQHVSRHVCTCFTQHYPHQVLPTHGRPCRSRYHRRAARVVSRSCAIHGRTDTTCGRWPLHLMNYSMEVVLLTTSRTPGLLDHTFCLSPFRG